MIRAWVSVDERLPRHNGDDREISAYTWQSDCVLVTDGHRIEVGAVEWDGRSKGEWVGRMSGARITHWMPLPELPGDKDER